VYQQALARHTFKRNFVRDLPDVPKNGAATRALGVIVNDWRLSGAFTGGSGARFISNFPQLRNPSHGL
jgi:hypothetical protein